MNTYIIITVISIQLLKRYLTRCNKVQFAIVLRQASYKNDSLWFEACFVASLQMSATS